ncbi:ABC transporter [Sporanaerobium hydrogeniformans]|uniref:ABC transporter n=1 Tax=Sporanaerobium hydrogeniformans TaxID=3072179 RepID=A0AC61D9C6_9FIRM|nr:ATP-binding cassette domain-containing protein [Sporanaerobium hydrogeniformans]PHV69306.1 ABC transporter [Sporanaerobium hydrogeniformans]
MENIIQVLNLVKSFKEVKAVDDISFEVKRGELFGFLGVNGAGKSTTINMLCTLFGSTSGQGEICGFQIGKHNKEIRRKIGVVFQGNTLDDKLTIKENLVSRAYLFENNSHKVKKDIDRVCEVLEIGELLNKRFKKLSGGQKRRCEIARALINNPEILFLDEPTTGLDPRTRQMVWKCIEYLRREYNMTIFLTTHYMEEASKAEHIAVIDKGKIVADTSPFKFKELYSTDKLRIEVKDKGGAIRVLEEHGLKYEIATNCLEIKIPNSLSSISLLQKLESYITAFEVVQGTMEDAFLNITGKSIREI